MESGILQCNMPCLGLSKTPRNEMELRLRKEMSGTLINLKQLFQITTYDVTAQEHRMNVTSTTKIIYGKKKCLVNT